MSSAIRTLRSNLMLLNPSICPLCRKAFLRDRIKRLHVDRVPPDEAGVTPATPRIGYSQTQLEEIELLQRLALASGEDTPESELAQIIVEVEEWLTGRNADASRALRKALTAIQRHKRKESEWQNQSEMYRLLKHEYKRKRKIYDHDMTRAKIVEDNLMEHLQNLESQHRSKSPSTVSKAHHAFQTL
ncbi:hypothetical protein GLOTRDRAFT_133200 [Gloeophyllum trabeum ATCC 11539]|uniref:Uncharacterized protein n=1 Tax=Gloeophyllum trabeum (strain ATCC 11539 / FP-39264 / Madison 617) TaxID=670483 RepID=S7PV88_GLOTA|nr:uncharacterized protein GLOTRDRAFT_133200 [Gloeophyllum trabeum ATCC 11539]EPQ51327.1 hypothetical protein GLOTRDRAFT_133200 [Gloeophyllum trabeum ATCC 11539]